MPDHRRTLSTARPVLTRPILTGRERTAIRLRACQDIMPIRIVAAVGDDLPAFRTLPNKPADVCQHTTAAWGHVGWGLTDLHDKWANWGGGGDGSGMDDYGCGGSNVTQMRWDEDTWYTYTVQRGAQRGPQLWVWAGAIADATGRTVYQHTMYGGEYLTYATVWTELIGVRCADPAIGVEWSEPYVGNAVGKFRIGNIDLIYTNDGCRRSRQTNVSTCPAAWRQDEGSDT